MHLLDDPKIQNPAMNLLRFPYRRTAFGLYQLPRIHRSLLARKRQVFHLVSKDTGQGLQDQWQGVKIRKVWLEECKVDHHYRNDFQQEKTSKPSDVLRKLPVFHELCQS
jgi:hypothetical protein